MVKHWTRLPRAFVSLEDAQKSPAHNPQPPAPAFPALSRVEQDSLPKSPTSFAALWFCVYNTAYTTLLHCRDIERDIIH